MLSGKMGCMCLVEGGGVMVAVMGFSLLDLAPVGESILSSASQYLYGKQSMRILAVLPWCCGNEMYYLFSV